MRIQELVYECIKLFLKITLKTLFLFSFYGFAAPEPSSSGIKYPRKITLDEKWFKDDSKYTFLGVVASWDELSKNLVKTLISKEELLRKKKINIRLEFMHDTQDTMDHAKKEWKIPFDVYLISKSTEKLKPDVPTLWLLEKQKIIHEIRYPTSIQIQSILLKMTSWVEF
jgi:hypothetical protein